jgi:hypothetical protein
MHVSLNMASGVTLDTAGFMVQVRGTLEHRGVITDNQSGGGRGPGGLGGAKPGRVRG